MLALLPLAALVGHGPATPAFAAPPAVETPQTLPSVPADPPPLAAVSASAPAAPTALAIRAVIDAPRAAALGQLVRLRADGSTGASVFAWRVLPPDAEAGLEPSDGGRRATFAAQPGEYTLILSVAGVDAGTKQVQISVAAQRLTIGSGVPVPPGPVAAARLHGAATDYAATLAAAAKDVPADALEDLPGVAEAFGFNGGRVGPGGLATRDDAIRETIKTLRTTLGEQYEPLRPVIAALVAAAKKDRRSTATVWKSIEDAVSSFDGGESAE